MEVFYESEKNILSGSFFNEYVLKDDYMFLKKEYVAIFEYILVLEYELESESMSRRSISDFL